MKRFIPCLILTTVFVSATYGDYDYTISDSYEYGIFTLDNNSLLVTGAGAYNIRARNNSYVEVQNTAMLQINAGGIYTLDLDDTSTMNFYNGSMGGFNIYKDAEVAFSGGRIDYIHSFQDSDVLKHITFICNVDSVNYNTSTHQLTGDWLNGKGSFNIILENQANYDSVYSNINFVPEPATLLTLSLGGLLIRRKK